MKRTLYCTALLAALTLPSFAGTDTAPMARDSKDMKDVKQVATEQSDAGFYVAAYGGAQFDTDYGDNRQTASAGGATLTTNAKIHSGWGGVGGIKAGYNFNSFAFGNFMGLRLQPGVEVEGLYIGDSSHANDAFVPGGTARFTTNSGDFFVNGILRFKNSSIVTPYIGGGVGLQYISTHGEFRSDGGLVATGVNTDDVDFAVQGLAGFDVAICNHVSLFSEYKFIDAFDTDGSSNGFVGGAGGTYHFKPDEIQQHLITAGVKYSF